MAFKKFTASAKRLAPDPRYQSKLVSKFINTMMWDGKKAVVQKVFYGAMDIAVWSCHGFSSALFHARLLDGGLRRH